MMNKTKKKIVILMDEIDGMNKGDKGGITSLIKRIRQKKTKKQNLENVSMNPIICIGNYAMDKKIKELMKVCTTFELKAPTDAQIQRIFQLSSLLTIPPKPPILKKIVHFIQGDMQKLQFVLRLYEKTPEIITEEMLDSIFYVKMMNCNSKKITESLLTASKPIAEYSSINETDRTIIALLWHENIADVLPKSKRDAIPFYHAILGNICYSDFIDRITFQNQIWQFNEMSFLMKTCYNTKLFHETFPKNTWKPGAEVRFTKILTKYSTEYNNQMFIYHLSQRLDMDKKDLVAFFQEWRLQVKRSLSIDGSGDQDISKSMDQVMETYNINKLDIKRMYRFIEKSVMKEVAIDEVSDGDEEDLDN